MKSPINIIKFILGLILLAGCNGFQQATVEAPQPTQIQLEAPVSRTPTGSAEDSGSPSEGNTNEPVQPTVIPVDEPSITDTPGLAEDNPPTQPAVKTGLTATDPGSVQLASGSPQLIEFFAFW